VRQGLNIFPMASRSDTFLTSSGPTSSSRQVRPTRIAILLGSKLFGGIAPQGEIRNVLGQQFLPLNVHIFSVLEMTQSGMSDLVSSLDYDVVGLIGKADEFDFVRKKGGGSGSSRLHLRTNEAESQRDLESIVLAFAPSTQFGDVKKDLKIADAIVFCDASGKNWQQDMSKVIYHFFESLVVPSMLNIDLADVKHIAKGIGLAFSIADDTNNRIIAKLPKSCLVARSALLHFSCYPDVRLKEVYSISKAIALKKGISNFDSQINTHADAKKLIRKVNVKMGIRIRNGNKKELSVPSSALTGEGKRISLTAILFGL
jgi:hypothetical protein